MQFYSLLILLTCFYYVFKCEQFHALIMQLQIINFNENVEKYIIAHDFAYK